MESEGGGKERVYGLRYMSGPQPPLVLAVSRERREERFFVRWVELGGTSSVIGLDGGGTAIRRRRAV